MKLDLPEQKFNQVKNLYYPRLFRYQIRPIRLMQQHFKPTILSQTSFKIELLIIQLIMPLIKQQL